MGHTFQSGLNLDNVERQNKKMSNNPSDILVEAFLHDPLFEHLWPDTEQRAKQLKTVMDFLLSFATKKVFMKDSDGQLAGIIGAFSPGKYPPSFLDSMILLTKMPWIIGKMLWNSSWQAMKKLKNILKKIETIHPHQPHWYIMVIGVKHSHQGKKIGWKLIEPILLKAYEQQVIVYLECSNPRSLQFYLKLGFEVKEELIPFEGCPSIWGLIREPKALL